MKPSTFCKRILKLRHVKSEEFIEDYFADIDTLVKAIEVYHSNRGDKSN
jgi:hypothetical protein